MQRNSIHIYKGETIVTSKMFRCSYSAVIPSVHVYILVCRRPAHEYCIQYVTIV